MHYKDAVKKHIKLFNDLGVDEFTVQAFNAQDPNVISYKYEMSGSDITSDKWCKRFAYLNGYKNTNIYITPKRPERDNENADYFPIAMLDDLDAAAIKKAKDLDIELGCIVETSPGNYAAWVKIHNSTMKVYQVRAYQKALQDLLNSDKGASSVGHLSRLAGFSNKKTEYADKPPFMAKVYGSGKPISEEAFKILTPLAQKANENEEHDRAEMRKANDERLRASLSAERGVGETIYGRTLQEAFLQRLEHYRTVCVKPDGSPDDSKVDFNVAKKLYEDGWSDGEVESMISQLVTRDRNKAKDYLSNTLNRAKAYANSDSYKLK